MGRDGSWYVAGELRDWHKPDQFKLFAYCPVCKHAVELHIPGLISGYRLPPYLPMEQLRTRLKCGQCGRKGPALRKLPHDMTRQHEIEAALEKPTYVYRGLW